MLPKEFETFANVGGVCPRNTISVNPLQPEKVAVSILVTDAGKTTLISALQLKNALSPSVSIPGCIVNCLNIELYANAYEPILSIEAGNSIDVSLQF